MYERMSEKKGFASLPVSVDIFVNTYAVTYTSEKM